MLYADLKDRIRKIALESGAYIAPSGNGKKRNGTRTIRLEALHCPFFDVRCAPGPEAMIDRLKEEWYTIEAKPKKLNRGLITPFIDNELITWDKLPENYRNEVLKRLHQSIDSHYPPLLTGADKYLAINHFLFGKIPELPNSLQRVLEIIRFKEPIDCKILWCIHLNIPAHLFSELPSKKGK